MFVRQCSVAQKFMKLGGCGVYSPISKWDFVSLHTLQSLGHKILSLILNRFVKWPVVHKFRHFSPTQGTDARCQPSCEVSHGRIQAALSRCSVRKLSMICFNCESALAGKSAYPVTTARQR
jgi:hypothetical protein